MSDRMVDSSTGDRAVRYRPIAVAIHWTSALLILIQIGIGLLFVDMPRGPVRAEWLGWHKSVGVIILFLALLRLAVRLTNSPPPFPSDFPKWERFAAVWSHRLFYFLLIALPVTGLSAVSDHAVNGMTPLVGGLKFPVIPIPGVGDDVHGYLAWAMIVLLIIHVGAALKQQFFDRTAVADRMPPFRSTKAPPPLDQEAG